MWFKIIGIMAVITLYTQSPAIGQTGQSVASPISSIKGHHQCGVCHTINEINRMDALTSETARRTLVKNIDSICIDCHSSALSHGHAIGKQPLLNREQLPLDRDGRISCALTCHKIHVKSSDVEQNRYSLRLPANRLCFSCHEK